jgi:GxxExxY protein
MPISRGRVLIERELTQSVIQAFYYVYNRLDYGFLESIYVEALTRVLRKKGHVVEREVWVTIYLDEEAIGLQRVDMIVDHRLVVETKSSHDLPKRAHRQLASYLRGSELQVGLLLHFGPRPEFYRIVDTRNPRRSRTDPP